VKQATRLVSKFTWSGFEMMLTTQDSERLQHWSRLNSDVAVARRYLATIQSEIEMSYWECYDLFGTGEERRQMSSVVKAEEAICTVLSAFCGDSWRKLDETRGGDHTEDDWEPVCHLMRAVENGLVRAQAGDNHLLCLQESLQSAVSGLGAVAENYDFSSDILEAVEIRNDDALVRLVIASRAQYIGNVVLQLLSDLLSKPADESALQPLASWVWSCICTCGSVGNYVRRATKARQNWSIYMPIFLGNMFIFVLAMCSMSATLRARCVPTISTPTANRTIDLVPSRLSKPHYSYVMGINVALLLSLKRRLQKETIEQGIQRVFASALPVIISRMILDRTSEVPAQFTRVHAARCCAACSPRKYERARRCDI